MLYCISCYFNPIGFANRLENFKHFYACLQRSGVKHLIVELGTESVLKPIVDAGSLLFLNDEAPAIWQKERLLNIAIGALPADCTKVCWIDCDVVFQRHDWPALVSEKLDRYTLIQPFSFVVNLPRGITNVDTLDVDSFPLRHNNCSRMYSYFLGLLDKKIDRGDGHPGFFWAAQKSLLTKHGLYDKNILSGGDHMISRAAAFAHYNEAIIRRYTKYHLATYYRWAQPFCDDIALNINAINIPIFHLYHGQISDRAYDTRLDILKQHDYNPRLDLKKTQLGAWQFTNRGRRLATAINTYFERRNEDG